MKTKINKEQIVDQYTVHGVPMTSLSRMCQELKINEDKLRDFLVGQTMGVVGGEPIVYPYDIKRFINGLPNLD
jgi:hypothetical protein